MSLNERKKFVEALKNDPGAIVKEASRRRLINFAKYMQPDMVFEPFHKVYYELLDKFAHGKIKKMIIQMPPQHGKSEGSSRKLPAFILGLNPDKKIAIGSYSTSFARDFNRDVQRIIDTPRYRELFQRTFLSGSNVVTVSNAYLRNSDVIEMVGHRGSLRVVGRGGALTGKSVDVSILDDVYKDYGEANSPVIREAAWRWYTTVVQTRLDNNSQEIIVFTRWHSEDIIGKLEKTEGVKIIDIKSMSDIENIPKGAWIRINFEAIKTGEPTEIDPRLPGTALWESKHSLEKLRAKQLLDKVQFDCLYQGNARGAEGKLYQPFKTYVNKSDYGIYVRTGCYVDTKDEGSDNLCAISYDIYRASENVWNEFTRKFEPLIFALVTDIEYTSANTDVTTVTVPRLINANKVQRVWIESNGGGAQFEKSVKHKVKANTVAFHQGANKESRIITAAGPVTQHIVFPFGWEERFKQAYEHITDFLANFSANEHDDIEDVITGIYEKEIADGNIKPYSAEKRGVTIHN